MKLLFLSAILVDLPIRKPLDIDKALTLLHRVNEQLQLEQQTDQIEYQLEENETILFESFVELPQEELNLLGEIEKDLTEVEGAPEKIQALKKMIYDAFPKTEQKIQKKRKRPSTFQREKKETVKEKIEENIPQASLKEPVEPLKRVISEDSLMILFFDLDQTSEIPQEHPLQLKEGLAYLAQENQRLEKEGDSVEITYQLLEGETIYYESTTFLPQGTFNLEEEIRQDLTDAKGDPKDIDYLLNRLQETLTPKQATAVVSPPTQEEKRSVKEKRQLVPLNEKQPERRLKASLVETLKQKPIAKKGKPIKKEPIEKESLEKPQKNMKENNPTRIKDVERQEPRPLPTKSRQEPMNRPLPKQSGRFHWAFQLLLVVMVWSLCLMGVFVLILRQELADQQHAVDKLEVTTQLKKSLAGQENLAQGSDTEKTDTKDQTQIRAFTHQFLTRYFRKAGNDASYQKQMAAWIDPKDLKVLHNPDKDLDSLMPWKISFVGDHWDVQYIVQYQDNDDSHILRFQVAETAVDQFEVTSPITQTVLSINHVK